MIDVRRLELLTAILAAQGITLRQIGEEYSLELPVGADRDQVIAELVKMIVRDDVRLRPKGHTQIAVGKCSECHYDVLWLTSPKTQKKIAVDRRELQVVTNDGTVVRGREAHMSTCPYRDRVLSRRAQDAHRRALEEGKG